MLIKIAYFDINRRRTVHRQLSNRKILHQWTGWNAVFDTSVLDSWSAAIHQKFPLAELKLS